MINLGDKVKDSITNCIGIAVAKVSYLQGCDRIAIQSIMDKKGIIPEWRYFDEPQLIVLKSKIIKQGNRITGGWKPDNAEKNF